MKIYTAGAISGKGATEVFEYFVGVKTELEKHNFQVLCPLTGKAHLRTEVEFKAADYRHPISTNHAIIERDRWMVKQADVVYVNLVGTDRVSIGSMMEMAWAHDNGVHTVVAMEPNNIHRHAFVLEAADIVFETHDEAMRYLANLGAGAV